MTRGFVTVATGREDYYKLAFNLLASYRYHTSRPMPWAILCDEENEYTRHFDTVVLLEGATRSLWDKIRLLDSVPYDENIFIEADCLAYRDLNGLWRFFRNDSSFSYMGEVLPLDSPSGFFNPSHLGVFSDSVDHQVMLQGGIYYFRRGPLLDRFSDTCHRIYERFSDYEFRIPTEESVYALASVVHGITPPINWSDVYCFYPESRILKSDILSGRLRYVWEGMDWRVMSGKYLIHFTNNGTCDDFYKGEASAVQAQFKAGNHPSLPVRLSIRTSSLWERSKELLRSAVPLSVKEAVVKHISLKQ